MSDVPCYYNLRSKTRHPCFLTREARDEAHRTWLCPGIHPKPNVRSVDVQLQEGTPCDQPLNFVYSCGVPLVHWELLALIGSEIVKRDLYIGRIADCRGRAIKDWVTARGRRRTIVRGTQEAVSRSCPYCGRTLYSARGRPYLYPAPPADAAIFENDYLGLVVSQHIYERIAARNWRRLVIEPLPILDPPPDGLGLLPESG